jgi:hypothetical protein
MLSPDEDFSPAGAKSGIMYAESFRSYKKILSDNPDSPMYKRIFEHFDTALFAPESASSTTILVDDGNYDAEIAQFMSGLLKDPVVADPPVAGVSEAEAGADETLAHPLPPVPVQSESHVSIAVTSHISHTIAASSQISNIVHSSVTLSPEHEEISPPSIEEVSPPSKEKGRPAPRKKGGKALKPAAEVPDDNTDAVPIKGGRTTRQNKLVPVEPPLDPPGRTLRKRG